MAACLSYYQDVLLSVTNTFEGRDFVSATIAANQTITDYISQLMPQFTKQQIQEAARVYSNVGSDDVLDQAIAIMGECKLFHKIIRGRKRG